MKKRLKQETPLEIPITKGVIKLTRTIWSQSMSWWGLASIKYIGEIKLENKQRLESPTSTELQ